ncbi:hypothetical protein QBC44DRAFT_307692 [Cladorrhinum sp. PSN332]|nr:hypothetical protein QBC44DRAFT_307692 [Cladorrhinum sp. PSN332]
MSSTAECAKIWGVDKKLRSIDTFTSVMIRSPWVDHCGDLDICVSPFGWHNFFLRKGGGMKMAQSAQPHPASGEQLNENDGNELRVVGTADLQTFISNPGFHGAYPRGGRLGPFAGPGGHVFLEEQTGSLVQIPLLDNTNTQRAGCGAMSPHKGKRYMAVLFLFPLAVPHSTDTTTTPLAWDPLRSLAPFLCSGLRTRAQRQFRVTPRRRRRRRICCCVWQFSAITGLSVLAGSPLKKPNLNLTISNVGGANLDSFIYAVESVRLEFSGFEPHRIFDCISDSSKWHVI